jgi:hypothetical protein
MKRGPIFANLMSLPLFLLQYLALVVPLCLGQHLECTLDVMDERSTAPDAHLGWLNILVLIISSFFYIVPVSTMNFSQITFNLLSA